MKQSHNSICLIAIILLSVAIQLFEIDRDLNGLHEYDSAQHMVFFRNLLQTDPFEAKFGFIANINPLDDKPYYYLYHPRLFALMYIPFLKFIGTDPMSGRLVAMLFSMAATISLFLLVRELYSSRHALWAAFFFAFSPINLYFGKLVNQDLTLLPFLLLCIYFYCRWIKKSRLLDFSLMMLFLIIACQVEWPAYYLAGLLTLHHYFILQRKDIKPLYLPIAAIFSFLLFLGHNFLLTGSWLGQQSQWPLDLHPQSHNFSEEADIFTHGLLVRMKYDMLLKSDFYLVLIRHALNSFGIVPILAPLFLLLGSSRDKLLHHRNLYIMFVPTLLLIHTLLFPQVTHDHIFQFWYALPASALVMMLIVIDSRLTGKVLVTSCFMVSSWLNLSELYVSNNTNQDELLLAKAIPAFTKTDDKIAITWPYFSPFIEYFAQRKILYNLYDWQKLQYVREATDIDWIISNIKEFNNSLVESYAPLFISNEFVAFSRAEGHRHENPPINIAFSNGFRLRDFSFSFRGEEWLLAEYAWDLGQEPIKPSMIFVHFEDQNGNSLFNQDHFLANGLIDISRSAHSPVTERYLIYLPDNVRNKKLEIYLGNYNPTNGERYLVLNKVSSDNRVHLASIAHNLTSISGTDLEKH